MKILRCYRSESGHAVVEIDIGVFWKEKIIAVCEQIGKEHYSTLWRLTNGDYSSPGCRLAASEAFVARDRAGVLDIVEKETER